MKLETSIEVKLDTPDEKGLFQLVCVLIQHRETLELDRIRLRVHTVDPDMAIIRACEQILGVEKNKGVAMSIRPTREVSTLRILGAWLIP